jgi:hypothetical protein
MLSERNKKRHRKTNRETQDRLAFDNWNSFTTPEISEEEQDDLNFDNNDD